MKIFRFYSSFFISFLFAPSPKACLARAIRQGSKKGFLLIIISSVFLTQGILAQNLKEKAIYDSLTYYYSENAVWDSVIDIGKESIYKGYDFYTLRMRMGNAYDHQGNFRLSEKNYTKALEFKPSDANAAFYQYQAAINGGRQDVAYYNYKSFNKEQKQLILGDHKVQDNSKLPVKLKALEQASFFTGYSFTNNENNFDEILPLTPGLLYQQTHIRSHQFFAQLGLKGNISPKLNWSFAYNYNQINANYLFREKNFPLISKKANIKQHEIFGNISVFSGTGWSFSAYGILLNYSKESYNNQVDVYNYYITAENDSILGTQPNFKETYENDKSNDYVVGVKIKKTINIFDLSVFASYSDLLSATPLQVGGEITILPKGSYDFFLTNRLSYFEKSGEGNWLYKVNLGGKLIQNLHFFAAAYFGDLQYSNEIDLGMVYNWTEPTSFKADFGLSYPINKSLWISAHYQFYQKESNINQSQLYHLNPSEDFVGFYEPQYKDSMDTFKFNEHFVFLGFVWYL